MLTPRQKQIRDFINKIISENDVAPSEREIARRFRISPSTAHEHLITLKDKGYLVKVRGRARAIEPANPKRNQDITEIPLLGIIAAGEPIEAIENKETIPVQKSLLSRSGEHFALKVQGNSMIDEGIFDGSIVILRKQPTVENGETAVALVNGNEVTLKKIYREKDRFRLQPANPDMKPIFTKELIVQGKVVSVIRNFEEFKKIKSIGTEENKIKKERELEPYLNKVYLGDIIDLLKKLPEYCM